MNSSIKSGFTLVELIVVITILAILGTIAFISLQGYSRNARDGVRTSDITNLAKALEIYVSEVGTYPIPSKNTNILYSGATVWSQGTVGDSLITNLQTINKKPTDPSLGNEYAYSTNMLKNEYQIGAVLEGESVARNIFIENTYASINQPITYIKGNYNGKILITSTGGIDYVLAVPSMMSNDLYNTELVDIVNNNKILYQNYVGLPASYTGTISNPRNDFTYLASGSSILVFTGHLSTDLYGEGIFRLVDNIHSSYSGSIINDYNSTDINENKSELATFTWEIIKKLYGLPKLNTLASCKEVLEVGKSDGDGYYHFFSLSNRSVYETYCDMSNGGRNFLFSVNPSGTTWKFDNIQWTKPEVTPSMNTLNIMSDEMTSGAYGEFVTNKIKICRGNFTNCYIINHNQNRTLKSFYNIGDSFLVYTACLPGSRCTASPFPTNYGDITEKNKFLALTTPATTSGQPKIGFGINVSSKNRLGIQFDDNNIWPDFDNGGFGIGVFRSRDCGRNGTFVDNTRARSVSLNTSCVHVTPDTQMWYVFAQ